MRPMLLVALYHASVALHVPFQTNQVNKRIIFKFFLLLCSGMTKLGVEFHIHAMYYGSAREYNGIYEGDIILSDAQQQNYIDQNDVYAEPYLVSLWPNREIRYVVISEHFNEDQLQAIDEAFQDLNTISCLNFKEISEDSWENAVIITVYLLPSGTGDDVGCYSNIGYQNERQFINLSNRYDIGYGCFRHGSIIHEILHTLGFHHTHARYDRDEYVDIIWNNIKKDQLYGFLKQISPRGIDYVTSYNYNSCMHYSRKAFSRTGEDTIVPKLGYVEIGQRRGLSQGDIEMLNLLYCK